MPDVEVEGPDGNTYQFPDGTDKAAAIRYFKTKGIGAASSKPMIPAPAGTPSLASAPGGSKSQPEMQQVRTLTGAPYHPLPGQQAVADTESSLIKPALGVAAAAPTAMHRAFQKAGILGPGSRLFPGEHTMEQVEKRDIPNAVLMTTGGIEGEGADATMPRGRTVPPPPRDVPLDPKTQAGYTAELDKANADFNSQAQKYHEGVTKSFDEAKREQIEGRKKHDIAVQNAIDESRQNAQRYHDELSNTFDKAKRQQLTDAAKYETEREEWLRKTQEYHKAQAEAETATTKQRQLQAQSKSAVKATYDNLKQVYNAARSDLSQRWNQFRSGMEDVQLDAASAFNNIESAKAKYLKGSPASLQVFNNLAREMGIQEFMEGDGGELTPIAGSGELPFDTARVHYSAIGDKLAQGDLPGNVYQALKSVEGGLDKQLSAAAAKRGLAEVYSDLKSEESQFRSDWTDPGSPLAKAYKALDPNFLEPQVLGRGNDYITKQLERYRKYGAEPHLPLSARRLAEDAKAVPKVKVPAAPGPEPLRPDNLTEAASPKLARPATVPEPPGTPEKTMPKSPELKPVARPKPATPKAGKVARVVGRVAGKVVGGAVGSKLGHPLVGYGIGGELGTEAAERWARRGRVPPPPDE